MVKLTKEDLKRVGLKVNDLAAILGVHRTSISDMLSGKTEKETPGAAAIVFLWAHLSDSLKKALLKFRSGSSVSDPK